MSARTAICAILGGLTLQMEDVKEAQEAQAYWDRLYLLTEVVRSSMNSKVVHRIEKSEELRTGPVLVAEEAL